MAQNIDYDLCNFSNLLIHSNIDSERRLEEEVRYNMAYRWFLGLSLDAPVPDHSTISQNRRRRFHGRDVFREIFEKVVEKCAAVGLVQGERVVMDSTHIKANADNRNSQWVGVVKTPRAYWDELGVAELPAEGTLKSKNPCDPEAGYMNRTGKPKGFHYLDHQCSDADTGIILDVFVTGGDVQDCECCTERFQYLKEKKGISDSGGGSGQRIRYHSDLLWADASWRYRVYPAVQTRSAGRTPVGGEIPMGA